MELLLLALWLGAPVLISGVIAFALLMRKRAGAPWSKVGLFSAGWFGLAFAGELAIWALSSQFHPGLEDGYMVLGFINTPALASVLALLLLSYMVIFRRSQSTS